MSTLKTPSRHFGALFLVSPACLRWSKEPRKKHSSPFQNHASNFHSSFIYCINVYLKNMWSDDKTEINNSSGLPSYTSSFRTHSAKAVYRRVRKVVWLQWRSMLIVVF